MWIYTILGILLLISVCANYAQYKIICAGLRRESKLRQSIFELKNSFESCLNEMREIDNRQMFELDDEVGSVFKKLSETIYKTNEKIEN